MLLQRICPLKLKVTEVE
uniref:Uncharacterized protein n=1 Tax=Rhizophora mucronata TaxID=61149 RepID=A0A2P2NJP5_RHIMU